MADIVIKNAVLITLDHERRIIKDGGIAIGDGRILSVGTTEDISAGYGGEEIIDGRGMVAIPGLINAHTHMYQDLLRGLGDDMALMEWLRNMLLPNNAAVTPEDAYVGSLLGCVEMLKTGTTYVIDNHHANTTENGINSVAKAIEESGIRGMIARGMRERETRIDLKDDLPQEGSFTSEEDIKITESLMEDWNAKKNYRVRVCPGPTSTMVCGTEFLQKAKELSDKFNVPIHTHIAEVREEVDSTLKNHGLREVEYLRKIGVLGPRFHVVHGVWLDAIEIRLMAESGAHLIHNPVSNMILASGVAPVQKMIDAGVNVALGTDGPASNNNQDMVSVLKATSLLQKVSTLDPKVVPCEKALEMATLGGARALNLEGEIGSLEPEKRADIVLVDLMKPHIMPIHNPVSALVYSAMGSDVHTVMVDGKIVVRGGKILTVNEVELLNRSQEVADNLVQRSNTSYLRDRPWPTT
jgi:5-methylthioadenosine/S-adenosylhomocysteine deaminase